MTAGIMRGRFAPSPTGYLHLGNVWTAFLCWLQVRQQGGKLILRIEDNDEQRSKELFRQAFLEDLTWLGLLWDEGPDTGDGRSVYAAGTVRCLRGSASAAAGKGLALPVLLHAGASAVYRRASSGRAVSL